MPVAAAELVEGKKWAGLLACKDAVEIMGGIYDWGWSAVIDTTGGTKLVTGRVPDDVPEYIDAMTLALLR